MSDTRKSSAQGKKKILIAVILVALAVAVALILFVFTRVYNAQDNTTATTVESGGTPASELEGIWKLDDITAYEFDGHDRGVMLTAVDNYTFAYTAQDGKLNIDFDYEGATDSEYTYTINGDKLTMSRNGKDYELTKSNLP